VRKRGSRVGIQRDTETRILTTINTGDVRILRVPVQSEAVVSNIVSAFAPKAVAGVRLASVVVIHHLTDAYNGTRVVIELLPRGVQVVQRVALVRWLGRENGMGLELGLRWAVAYNSSKCRVQVGAMMKGYSGPSSAVPGPVGPVVHWRTSVLQSHVVMTYLV
jgi:hypothetical protein